MADRKKRTIQGQEAEQTASGSETIKKESQKGKSPKTGRKKEKNNALIPLATSEKEQQRADVAASEKQEKSEREADAHAGKTSAKKAPASAENLPVARTVGSEIKASTVPIHLPEQERRSMWGRIAALLLIASVLFASVMIFLFRPTTYTEKTHSIRYLFHAGNQVTYVVVDGDIRGAEGGYSGELKAETASANGSTSAAIIGDRLYVVKGRKVTEMASGAVDCVLSADGGTVAWRNASNELYYATAGKPDSAKRVNGNVQNDRYCLSPNGEELFYTYTDEDEILRINILSNSGKKPNMPENQNLYPVAIADDCDYLYYTDAEGDLYVFSRESGTKTKCGDAPTELVFNRDFSELMFRSHTEDKSEMRMYVDGTYFPVGNQDSDALASDVLTLSANRRVSVRGTLLSGRQYMTKTLFKNYYIRSNGESYRLVYLTREDDQGKLALVSYVDNGEQVTVTDKFVYFIQTTDNNNPRTNLHYVKAGETNSELFYNDVKHYCTNVDGSRLLYITSEGLFSCRVGGEHEWLSDHVVGGSLQVTSDDVFYFQYEPGKLGVSDNGEMARVVSERVGGYLTDGDTLYYVTDVTEDGIGTVYANFRNSRKSEKLSDGISSIR